jgi:hypothetical protein
MGKRFLRSIVQDQTANLLLGVQAPIDLPVNPLSHLILTVGLERPDESATSAGRILSDCFLFIDEISIRHRGEMIVQGSLADLMMVAAVITGYIPHGAFLRANGQEQFISFLIPLSRRPGDPTEGFPATMRGNLRFHFNVADASPGSATAGTIQIEAVELIEDSPTRYLKYTTNTRALAATGRQRVPLPIGNEILGVLLFNPATEITATEQSAWGKVMVVKDNVQQYYVESNWEALRADLGMRVPHAKLMGGHVHPHAAADTSTGQEALLLNQPPAQYGYLDFDPLKDGYYALDTAGVSDLELDMNSDVSTGTARYLPVELVAGAARP